MFTMYNASKYYLNVSCHEKKGKKDWGLLLPPLKFTEVNIDGSVVKWIDNILDIKIGETINTIQCLIKVPKDIK